ncbi:hypothetical protein DFH08DRAFT_979505 [Mycena albidolilacea]|uniref:Uncharacterized protein n=1 Tax=Mycena albidolilacea TaxID=1033008 RepID=A0AAD7E6E2_9AGAR|nr:hypothetical protein DFH08DRAFT_979505 [Mycena albidolilacea]
MPVSSIPSESESDRSPDFIAARIAAVERALSWVREGHEERERQDLTDAWLWDKCRATESLTEFCILRRQKTQRAENRRRARNYYLARRGERQQEFEWQQAERARQAQHNLQKSVELPPDSSASALPIGVWGSLSSGWGSECGWDAPGNAQWGISDGEHP